MIGWIETICGLILKSKSGCKLCFHHRASPESISCCKRKIICGSAELWSSRARSRKRRLPPSRKSPLLIAADDQWWRKQAALIDFGQIEMFRAFWLLRLGCRKIGSGLLLSRAGSLNGLWIKTVAASICVKISALYYTLLILPTPHIEQ